MDELREQDVMEGIVHMKIKYNYAGTFCFIRRNCGWSKGQLRGLEGSSYTPGRSRFKMLYKGEEIVKPPRKTMKKRAQVADLGQAGGRERSLKLML